MKQNNPCNYNNDKMFTQQGRSASHYKKQNRTKIKKRYIEYRGHRNRAIDIVADTSLPKITGMDVKSISGKGYRPCFRRFLLNVQCPNKVN